MSSIQFNTNDIFPTPEPRRPVSKPNPAAGDRSRKAGDSDAEAASARRQTDRRDGEVAGRKSPETDRPKGNERTGREESGERNRTNAKESDRASREAAAVETPESEKSAPPENPSPFAALLKQFVGEQSAGGGQGGEEQAGQNVQVAEIKVAPNAADQGGQGESASAIPSAATQKAEQNANAAAAAVNAARPGEKTEAGPVVHEPKLTVFPDARNAGDDETSAHAAQVRVAGKPEVAEAAGAEAVGKVEEAAKDAAADAGRPAGRQEAPVPRENETTATTAAGEALRRRTGRLEQPAEPQPIRIERPAPQNHVETARSEAPRPATPSPEPVEAPRVPSPEPTTSVQAAAQPTAGSSAAPAAPAAGPRVLQSVDATGQRSPGEQIVATLRAHGGPRVGEQVTLRLNPPELGHVRLTLHSQGNDLRGVIEVESARVMTELQREAGGVINRLAEGGIQVRRLEIQMPEQQGPESSFAHLTDQQQNPQQAFDRDEAAPFTTVAAGAESADDEGPEPAPGEVAAQHVGDESINVWM